MTPRPVPHAALSVLLALGAALASATYACSNNDGATTLHDIGSGTDGGGGGGAGQDGASGHDASSADAAHADASSHGDASQDATQDAPGQDDGASDAADESTFLDVSQDHNVYNEDGGPADAPIAVWDGA